ncbi:MAG: 6-phosphogluconolactonase [Oligoflexia bacterium]|nr:6-phosphogluconolactonase [Oligoflexia bacterium]
MKIQRFQTPDAIADHLFGIFKELSTAKTEGFRFFAPTGKTPRPFYAKATQSGERWIKKLRPIQIDEIRDRRRLYGEELRETLLRPGRIDAPDLIIDPNWTDRQFNHHLQSVLSQEIEFSFLGLGMNGHVGLHEPGDRDLSYLGGRVMISESTLKKLPPLAVPEAFTFGAGAFIKAKKIFLVVTGVEKKSILDQVIETPPTSQIPATLLKEHPDFQILTDIN